MIERVGSCSLCGGDVMGLRGGWWSVSPPPPDTCSACGAIAAGDVVEMVPRPGTVPVRSTRDGTAEPS